MFSGFVSNRDRIRTSVNVIGDSYGAAIVDHLSRGDLMRQDEDNERQKQLEAIEDGLMTDPDEIELHGKALKGIAGQPIKPESYNESRGPFYSGD